MYRSAYPNRTKPPCYGCEERTVGCHATCEGYIVYRRDLDAEKEQKRRSEVGDKESREVLVTSHLKAMDKLRKKRRK